MFLAYAVVWAPCHLTAFNGSSCLIILVGGVHLSNWSDIWSLNPYKVSIR